MIIMAPVITLIAIFIFMTSPIPILLLDNLIALNIIFALVILITTFRTRKGVGFLRTMAFLLSTISVFSINIASIWLILAKGTGFDGALICFISNFMTSQGNDGLAVGFLIFIALTWIQWLIIIILKRATKEVARRLGLEIFLEKESTIKAEYDSGAISTVESLSQTKTFLREMYFYSLLEGARRLISGNEIFRIVIFIATILGGILISANIHIEITTETIGIIIHRSTFIEAIKIYAPLAISSGILFMVPVFLHSIAVAITLSHTVIGKEVKEKVWKE